MRQQLNPSQPQTEVQRSLVAQSTQRMSESTTSMPNPFGLFVNQENRILGRQIRNAALDEALKIQKATLGIGYSPRPWQVKFLGHT